MGPQRRYLLVVSDHPKGLRRHLSIAGRLGVVAGVFVFALSMLTTSLYNAYLGTRAQQRLDAVTVSIVAEVHERLIAAERVTAATAGLFAASDDVTEREFDLYVQAVRLPHEMKGLGVVQPIPRRDLRAAEAAMAAERRPYAFLGETPGLAPTDLAFPLVMFASGRPVPDAGERFPLADPGLERRAILSAIGTGHLATTPLMEFSTGDRGFLLASPAEQADGRVGHVVVGPVHVDDLLAAAVAGPFGSEVEVRFGAFDTDDPIVDDRGVTEVFRVAGRQWWLHVSPLPSSSLTLPRWDRPLLILSSALLGTFAGLAAFALRRRHDTVEELAATVRLNAARDEFLGAVSHEIRTPLTAVVGFADELRSNWDAFDDEDRRELLRLIDEQGREVASLVQDLLVVGRADIRTLHLHTTDIEVREIVRRALESLPAEERDRVQDGVEGDRVHADPGRAAQVVRNLLVNAVQYGGRQIAVASTAANGHVRLRVIDDGEGIPESHEEAVFDAYVGIASGQQALPSIGLGLYVARRLAELMGGSLTYSRIDGLTVFELTLPAATTPATEPALT